MNCTIIGLDLAKRVFQLHWLEMETGEICRLQIKSQKVAEFFTNRKPCIIAMEAFVDGNGKVYQFWQDKSVPPM